MNFNRLIAGLIAFIAAVFVLSSSVFIVDQRNYAVVFSFGQIVRVIDRPGIQIKYPAPCSATRSGLIMFHAARSESRSHVLRQQERH